MKYVSVTGSIAKSIAILGSSGAFFHTNWHTCLHLELSLALYSDRLKDIESPRRNSEGNETRLRIGRPEWNQTDSPSTKTKPISPGRCFGRSCYGRWLQISAEFRPQARERGWFVVLGTPISEPLHSLHRCRRDSWRCNKSNFLRADPLT